MTEEQNENNRIFLINELYNDFNNNPYDEFSEKKSSEGNSSNSLNTSCSSIDINEDEEMHYIPSKLLDLSREQSIKMEDNNNMIFEKETINPFVNELDINSEPFFPKNKLSKINNQHNQFNNNNNNNNSNNKSKKTKNKKKKKNFVAKKGDWVCYNCKNINYSFRDKCNKCALDKEESEQKYIDAGKAILSKLNQLFP